MICDPCKRGGQANVLGWLSIAEQEHANCESSSCPCHHKTGAGNINREALKNK